jgi:prefoldin subunit 4
MLAREEEESQEAEVRWVDQKQINEFGRLNARLGEVRIELHGHQEILNNMDDATTELMMGDNDTVK